MKLLFFLTSASPQSSFLLFLEEFIKYKKFKCNLLFEKFDDYIFFKKKFVNNNDINVSILKCDRKKNLIFFENYCKKNNIDVCIINFANGVFNSKNILDLYEILKKLNIKTYLPISNSPLNGMFTIYDNIKFENHKLNEKYNNLINYKINFDKDYELNRIINLYVDYQEDSNQHIDKFKSKIPYWNFHKIKSNLRNKVNIFLYKYNTNQIKFSNKKNILFFLTKNDEHWITKYNNHYLCNKLNNIKSLINEIPKNCNLILKTHPRIKIEKKIEKYIREFNNVYISYDDLSFNLIKKSDVIIGYGTTAIVLALLLNKHVIEIGKESIFFKFNNPPVIRNNNFQNLKEKINWCLCNEVDKYKILSYFKALFSTNLFFYDNNLSYVGYLYEDHTISLLSRRIISNIEDFISKDHEKIK